MYLKNIRDIFLDRKGNIIGKYKKAAVMILIGEFQGEECIIYEKRALTLRSQPGDICFPGGKIEENESPKEAAIRETTEELGISPEDIEFLGEMDYLISPYGSIMYPFVGLLNNNDLRPNPSEVHSIIRIPLRFFMENEPLLHEIAIVPHLTEDFPYNRIVGGKTYNFTKGKLLQHFYTYKETNIWGFTAMITKAFVDTLKTT